jgi:lipoprotein NlpD
MAHWQRLLFLLAIGLVLAGCAPRTSVRVQPTDRPTPARAEPLPVSAGTYVVVRGDTLYGIAFRHGMDYRQLADLNAIRAPYTIYPGQRLRLATAPPPPPPVAATPRRSPSRGSVIGPIVADLEPVAPRSPEAATRPQEPMAPPPAPTAAQPDAVSSVPAATAATPASPSAPPQAVATSVAPTPVTPAPLPAGAPRWRWPAEGALVASFAANDPTRQGINIAGSAGQPVTAAADGVVVYSGSGLIGYGELVIVKHSDEWLSAYGHNRKRLVGEGEAVRAGQQIAEMGRSGASRDMLHFEIRRNGRPVDPQGLLPRR